MNTCPSCFYGNTIFDVMEGLLTDKLSWWERQHFIDDVDYTIIGSGIVGLSTAIELKDLNPEAKVLIIDKKSTPFGASTKNAGFACFGSLSEILDDVNNFGLKTTERLIQMRWKGLQILKSRISAEKMNYRPQPGIEIFTALEEAEKYRDKISKGNEIVESAIRIKDCFVSEKSRFGQVIKNKYEGSINPQKMLLDLERIAKEKGVKMLQGIKVDTIDYKNKEIGSLLGKLRYNRLIICTNGFSSSLIQNIDIKPARNQVLVTQPIVGFELDGCYHMNKGYVYFREINNRLLIGGGRHLAKEEETTDKLDTTDKIISYLENVISTQILKNRDFRIEHKWSGILGVGKSKQPLLERVDEDVWVAIRMGGMGVAIGSYIGRITAARVMEPDNTVPNQFVSE